MDVYSLRLNLNVPWTVAHGTSLARTNVYLDLGDGLGEAPIVPYYPYDASEVTDWLRQYAAEVAADPSLSPAEAMAMVNGGPPPARSALDMALHDRWARGIGEPVFRALGFSDDRLPHTSLTVSIPSNDDAFVAALAAMPDWPLLKLKLGSGSEERDRMIYHMAQTHFQGRICVDANGAWDVPTAARMITWLAERDVVFIEEPVRDASLENWRALCGELHGETPPLIADESLQNEEGLADLARYIGGINVKLAKAGGIGAAHRLISQAKQYGLRVLIGCMVESSLAVTAAAHLAPLADYLDLDGHLHIANDPFSGVVVDRGRVRLPDSPGLGVAKAQ